MPRPLRALLTLCLTVAYTVFAVAPTLHRCEHGGARAAVAETGAAPSHAAAGGHAQHAMGAAGHDLPGTPRHDERAPARCDCVGHACCAAVGALPAPIVLDIPVRVTLAPPAARHEPGFPGARPDRLLPLALAPPFPAA